MDFAFVTPSSFWPARSEILPGRPAGLFCLRSLRNPGTRFSTSYSCGLAWRKPITSTAGNTNTSSQQQSPQSSYSPTSPPPSSPPPSPSDTSNEPVIDYELGPGEIGVRFINTPMGRDVVAAAQPGEGLLSVGDSVGVIIPRACQSGLCGSCTCDVLDSSSAEGRQTIRACQAGVSIPDGGRELVVDVARMKNAPKRKDPMARFENMDTEYVAGAVPMPTRKTGLQSLPMTCKACQGTGEVFCYNCDGSGLEYMDREGNICEEEIATLEGSNLSAGESDGQEDGEWGPMVKQVDVSKYVCNTCVGMKFLRCPTCQGKGEVTRR